MSLIDPKSLSLTNVEPERHRKGALAMHPYFGKLDPALARTLIEAFSEQGNVVLDPFCGSGTVLHEALLVGRSVTGWDSSPLATMLATAKVMGITPTEREQLLAIKQEVSIYGSQSPLFQKILTDQYEIPLMPRVHDITSWFEPNALTELAFLRDYLNQKSSQISLGASILAKTAFSKIIIASSNQQGESTYRRVKKENYPGKVMDLFICALQKIIKLANEFNILMEKTASVSSRLLSVDRGNFKVSWDSLQMNIMAKDTRVLDNIYQSDVDLVVTSPPYLMSWDYGLYHKFRFYWLGYDLDSYEETEIGRHLRRKKDDVERYFLDMKGAFESISQLMKSKSRIVLINAPSVVYGKEVDTNAILAEAANCSNWNLLACIPSLDIPGPHHGMYASLDSRKASAPGSRGKKEHILVFERN